MRLLSFLKKPIITYQTIDRHDLPANKHHTTEQAPDQYTKYSKSLERDVVATEKKEGENLPSLFGKKNSKANSRSRLVAVSIPAVARTTVMYMSLSPLPTGKKKCRFRRPIPITVNVTVAFSIRFYHFDQLNKFWKKDRQCPMIYYLYLLWKDHKFDGAYICLTDPSIGQSCWRGFIRS